MATSKEYAYYIKGNKVAIVQRDWTFSGGQTLSQPGLNDLGAAGALFWKSPKESITNGLEMQYVYSPEYMTSSNAVINLNRFYVNGWTVIGGYLTFLRSNGNNTEVNWASSPYSAVTSGSAGDTGGQTRDYIVVRGSAKWNGLHRVQTAGTEGQLVTYTKVPDTLPYWEDQQVDFAVDETIYDGGGGTLHLADHFSAGDYIWISGCSSINNNGLFDVDSVTTSTTASSSKVTVGTKYYTNISSKSTDLDTENSITAAIGSDTDESDINIYKAHRDFCYIDTDVNVLNDENDVLDIPRYLANAVVYYVKAKYAEDAGEIEMKEYFMREFRRITEKHQSGKQKGIRMIQGFSLLR
jgi:hypothetical protein